MFKSSKSVLRVIRFRSGEIFAVKCCEEGSELLGLKAEHSAICSFFFGRPNFNWWSLKMWTECSEYNYLNVQIKHCLHMGCFSLLLKSVLVHLEELRSRRRSTTMESILNSRNRSRCQIRQISFPPWNK